MAMNTNSDSSDGMNEINITPFVDIVLVLLIIFMISTPAMVYRGMKVSLPSTQNGEDMSHVTLTLTLAKPGELYLDSRKIEVSELKAIVDKLKASNASADAVVSADADVSHGRVMEIADELRKQGIEQVGFATKPKGKK